MDWFTGIFVFALVASLATGKAYFRGVVSRDDDPRRYWQTVGCYVLLAVFGFWLSHKGLR